MLYGNWNASNGYTTFFFPKLGDNIKCQKLTVPNLKKTLSTAIPDYKNLVVQRLDTDPLVTPTWENGKKGTKNYYWVAESTQLIAGLTGDLYINAKTAQLKYILLDSGIDLDLVLPFFGLTPADMEVIKVIYNYLKSFIASPLIITLGDDGIQEKNWQPSDFKVEGCSI